MLQSSILPKLLAKEDITIRHGNYHTAWFDVKNRVLGLPNWQDMGKDVYDLLCGHEVGHALFTPESGWHDSPERLKGAPRSYLNVIEDARIEREIRNTYPGLIAAMQRGYNQLLKRDFFGDIYNLEWDQIKLIDKINLKTKLGSMIEVPFNDVEQVFLDRAFTNKTWDQVVQLAKDVLKYTQENQDELLQPQELPQVVQDVMDKIEEMEDNQEQEDQGPQGGHDDYPADQEEAPESNEGEEEVPAEEAIASEAGISGPSIELPKVKMGVEDEEGEEELEEKKKKILEARKAKLDAKKISKDSTFTNN